MWQSGDLRIGVFTFTDGKWLLNGLRIGLDSVPGTLFVLGNVAPDATPDVTFNGSISQNGCQYSSGNDGPWDNALIGNATFTISNSAIRISYLPLPITHSVGQTITVRTTATNVSLSPLNGVSGEVLYISAPENVNLDSSYSGPVDLQPGEASDFTYYYTAREPGEVFWRIRAISQSAPDSSLAIQTNGVSIQTTPANVVVRLANTIPTTVTRGQTNVFPLSISYTHPDMEPTAASLRLDSLRLMVIDESGAPLLANTVFSRIVLSAGYNNLTILENIPSESNISLRFTQPVFVSPGQMQRYSLLVDIDSLATAENFALALSDGSAINLLDANTLLRVSLDPSVIFPLQTASCRIDNPSQQLALSYSPIIGGNINYGQTAQILQLRLRHPGLLGNSQIQLSSISFGVTDSLGSAFNPQGLLDRIKIMRGPFVIGELDQFEPDDSLPQISLSSPATLNPGEVDLIDVIVSIKANTAYSGFRFVISDSTLFTVRDLSSGALIQAVTDTTIVPSGSIFPISSGWVQLKRPALPLQICLTSAMSPSVIAGTHGCRLLNLSVIYPADSSYSPIILQRALVTVLDSAGSPLDPTRLFDRIGSIISGQAPAYQAYVRLNNGSAEFDFGSTGLLLASGDSLNIQMIADMEAEPPYNYFVLAVPGGEALSILDATDTTHVPGVSIASGCDTHFPFTTGVTSILFPATRPVLSCQQLPAQISFPGQNDVIAFKSEFIYESASPRGDLKINEIRGEVLRRTPDGNSPVIIPEVFNAIRLVVNEQSVASDTTFPSNNFIISIPAGYVVTRGSRLRLSLECDLNENSPSGNYLITFGDSAFMNLTDLNLSNLIFPVIAGDSYPLNGAEISIAPANLKKSFTNYPNPFYPSRGEATTIGFVLPEGGAVDLNIYTITGDLVKKLVMNSSRGAGAYQSDSWSGSNDDGRAVIPGTYLCQISVKYISGKSETYIRKVAVLR